MSPLNNIRIFTLDVLGKIRDWVVANHDSLWRIAKAILRAALLLIALPLLSTCLILSHLLIPKPFDISYVVQCKMGSLESEGGCPMEMRPNEQQLKQIFADIAQKVETADRVSVMSKPFTGMTRLNTRATNDSIAVLTITDPKFQRGKDLSVICSFRNDGFDTFMRGAEIIVGTTTTLTDTRNTISGLSNMIQSCFPADISFVEPNEEIPVAAGAYATIEFAVRWRIDFFVDTMSKVLIYAAMLIFWILLLPTLREAWRFVVRGTRYFE